METYLDYTCNIGPAHIIKNARLLPCGFSICFDCLTKTLEKGNDFVCSCCGEMHYVSRPSELKPCPKINETINRNSKLFTTQIIDKIKSKMNNLKGNY